MNVSNANPNSLILQRNQPCKMLMMKFSLNHNQSRLRKLTSLPLSSPQQNKEHNNFIQKTTVQILIFANKILIHYSQMNKYVVQNVYTLLKYVLYLNIDEKKKEQISLKKQFILLQSDFTKIRKEILNLEKTIKNKEAVQLQKLPMPMSLSQIGITNFNFDRCGQGIIIKQSTIALQEDEYTFKTVTSSVGFQKGIHFWKILPLDMTKNELKIGISTSDRYELKTAFSDYNFGYAYYTTGQFRNGSNSNGFEYGVKFKNSGEVGILLDMNRGVLAFSYNNNYLGKAISSELLKKGPIYPCVALLHQAGFEFKCGMPIPQNILEQFQQ